MVGRRTADAQLLEPLDQRGLVVAGRGLREALRGGNLLGKQPVALRHLRQKALAALLALLVVRRLGVEAQEAVEANHLARGDELLLRARHVDDNRRAVELGADHLRGDRALPNQVVEPLLGRRALNRLAVDVRRTDGLVGLLGPLGLGLVVIPARVLLTVELDDLLLALGQRLLREVDRVGTHVGDETLLVEVLRHGHRLRDAHAQLAARLLLERRGGERRRREALCGLLLGAGHREGGVDAAAQERLGLLARLEARRELGLEERLVGVVGGVELRHDAVVGGRMEGDDFTLALHEQPYGNALHAARRERRPHLLPQHGRELEAHQTVQNAARLLGVDQIHVDRARVLDGVENRPLGDFVEYDALGLVHGETQHFGQVPCDGLSFAVFIGCEPDGLGLLRELPQLVDHLLLVARYFVDGLEPLRDVDAEVLLGQVADVSETRFDDVVLAEELLDGFGLGRGLDDY